MPKYLELEVSLMYAEPRIWRRFLIASDASFADLHYAIQIACDWEDYHLYEFFEMKKKPTSRGGRHGESIARPEGSSIDDEDAPSAEDIRIGSYFTKKGKACLYLYDFGDSWEHLVELKKIVEEPKKFNGRLTGGERAFPPEDCGGIYGYETCCTAATISESELLELDEDTGCEIGERKDWIGEWHPEDFDLEKAKKRFDC